MTDSNEKVESKRLFANDGTNWTSEPSPVDADKARKADEKIDNAAAKGKGPSATNEGRLAHTIVSGSSAQN